LNDEKLLQSAHDLSDGGLFTALIESTFQHQMGFTIETGNTLREDVHLFCEAQSRVLISVSPSNEQALLTYLTAQQFPYQKLGLTAKDQISINKQDWKNVLHWKNLFDGALEKWINC